MSIKVMTSVWEHSRQSAGSLLVLLAMADYADDVGYCWPSVAMLATKARLSERQVQYVLRALVETLEIRMVEAGGGRWKRNHYQVLVRNGAKTAPLSETVQLATGNGAIHDTKTVQPTAPLSVIGDPSVEPSEKKSTRKRITEVTELFRSDMRQRFALSLGNTVDERIEEALGHSSAKKYTDLQAYVRGWLRRDAERMGRNGGGQDADRQARIRVSGFDNSHEKYVRQALTDTPRMSPEERERWLKA